jgi:hypothetical protein
MFQQQGQELEGFLAQLDFDPMFEQLAGPQIGLMGAEVNPWRLTDE